MPVNSRSFLKGSGLSLLPAFLPATPILANNVNEKTIAANEPIVKLFGDGGFQNTGTKFGESLNGYFIRIPRPNENGEAKISVNETLLYREPKYIIDAIKESLNKAK